MGKVKEKIGFSAKAQKEFAATEKAFKKLSSNIIAKTKKNNSYLVVSDEDGNVKKIAAKDL
jgi:hypothetical protein